MFLSIADYLEIAIKKPPYLVADKNRVPDMVVEFGLWFAFMAGKKDFKSEAKRLRKTIN